MKGFMESPYIRCKITGKVMYPTLKDARTVFNHLRSRRGKHAVEKIYVCTQCNHYHLTHMADYIETPVFNKIIHEKEFEKFLNIPDYEPIPRRLQVTYRIIIFH